VTLNESLFEEFKQMSTSLERLEDQRIGEATERLRNEATESQMIVSGELKRMEQRFEGGLQMNRQNFQRLREIVEQNEERWSAADTKSNRMGKHLEVIWLNQSRGLRKV